MKPDKMSQKDVTTKAGAIIQRKLQYPKFNLKKISELSGCSYGYARNVWSKFIRQQLTIRGSPLTPMSVHGWFFWTQINPEVYYACPIDPSANRNMQKVWRGRKGSVVFHKSGSTFVYPYFMGWDEELRKFLLGWISYGEPHVDAIMSSLKEQGKKEIAISTPGVPKNLKFRIKGLGSFKTDKTPYPDGTTEWEFDPGFERRLVDIQRVQRNQVKSMETFAVAMREHVKLVRSIQDLVNSLQDVVTALRKKG